MNINDAFPSSSLKASDLPPNVAVRVTIESCTIEDMTGDGTDTKPVLHFQNREKGLALNKTNANVIASMYGVMTEDWLGKDIEIYNDPTVQFKGRIVGGLRVRMPVQPAAPSNPVIAAIADGQQHEALTDDDIPF